MLLSKSKISNISRDRDETVDYRLKSETRVNRTELFGVGLGLDDEFEDYP